MPCASISGRWSVESVCATSSTGVCIASWREPEMRRRTILGAGASVAFTGSLIGFARARAYGPWRFFTPSEARTVDAVCERLIPADRDPGAKFAGVVNYIDIQLTRAFRKHRQTYRQGLAEMDAASYAKFGQPFADLLAGTANRNPARRRAEFQAVFRAHPGPHPPGLLWRSAPRRQSRSGQLEDGRTALSSRCAADSTTRAEAGVTWC